MSKVIGIMLFATAFYAASAMAHDHWQWIAENPRTAYCCGDDCREVTGQVRYENGRYSVQGTPIPWRDVHTTAKGVRVPWSCFPNYLGGDTPFCLFLPRTGT